MRKSIKVIAFLTAFVFAVGFSGQTFASAKSGKGNAKAKVKKETVQKKVEKKKVVEEKNKVVKNEGNKYAKGKDKNKMPPVIKQGRLLIPVNAISKSLGAEVKWNQEEGKITIVKDGVEIVIDLEKMVAVVGDKEFKLEETTDKSISGRIVPIGFIAEKLGVKLSDEDEKEITEETKDQEGTTDNKETTGTTDQTTSTETTNTDSQNTTSQTTNTGSETQNTTNQDVVNTTTDNTAQQPADGQTTQPVSGTEVTTK